ncbi:MAG TPA: polymer-forming cytoskeletal protein [Longimicrobiales bacterium]|nr:polymer-forming cytoskeletal protein [Longimicrobiales bacterium]
MSSSELPGWAAGYLEKSHIFQNTDQNIDQNTDKSTNQNAPQSTHTEQTAATEVVATAQPRALQTAPVQQQPRNNAPAQRRGGPALLINDPHARIEGRFETTEEIEIGCDLTGEIIAGRLHITQTGNVSGVVHTVDAVIAGRFEGDIVATGSLEVLSGGFLGGNVQTDGLSIARGAAFRGQVQQLNQQQSFEQIQPESKAEPEPASEEPEPAFGERRATGPLIAVELPSEEPAQFESLLTPVDLPIDIPREGAA